MGVARSKRRPRGLPGRVVRYMSSQLTKLNGDFGREKCRDPLPAPQTGHPAWGAGIPGREASPLHPRVLSGSQPFPLDNTLKISHTLFETERSVNAQTLKGSKMSKEDQTACTRYDPLREANVVSRRRTLNTPKAHFLLYMIHFAILIPTNWSEKEEQDEQR